MADSKMGPGRALGAWAGRSPSGAITALLAIAWLVPLHPLAGWAFLVWVVGNAIGWARWKVAALRMRRDEWRYRRGAP